MQAHLVVLKMGSALTDGVMSSADQGVRLDRKSGHDGFGFRSVRARPDQSRDRHGHGARSFGRGGRERAPDCWTGAVPRVSGPACPDTS
jgi:hypothetical protein